MKTTLQSIRILIVFTLLTGFLYPAAVTLVAHYAFPYQAGGSLIVRGGKVTGSALLAQKFEEQNYFWPRPSAADYATVASGASNKGPTAADLAKTIDDRRTALGKDAPGDLLTASASGLDPHISPATATWEIARVAAARHLAPEKLNALVERFTEPPQLGVLGEPRVNVLALNNALDDLK